MAGDGSVTTFTGVGQQPAIYFTYCAGHVWFILTGTWEIAHQ
jgi:hypothetical protein